MSETVPASGSSSFSVPADVGVNRFTVIPASTQSSTTLPISDSGSPPGIGVKRRYVRAFDITVALLLIAMTCPVLVIAVILVGVTSPGPVIFRQARYGQHGHPFIMFKLRTMYDGAAGMLSSDAWLHDSFRQQWKLKDDPRITRVGKWLRRTSIDELPQLINILRGEMSIVGPRPVQMDEIAECYRDMADVVYSIRPGLTGLWQVAGRSTVSYEERIALDLEYLRRRSFWFDLSLVLRTVPAVLFMRGAA